MSVQTHYDVIIMGGGVVGLLLAAALATTELKVAVIEANKPSVRWAKSTVDGRVSAINGVSQRILRNVGVWSALRPQCYCPLRALAVWDSVGGATIDFASADLGLPALGAIVENRELVRVLWQHLQTHPALDGYCPAAAKSLITTEQSVVLTLTNGQVLSTRLLVGADGAHSWVRSQMTGTLHQRPYNQRALVAVIATQQSHRHTAWQAFLPDGILALLPLADTHQCASVWSADSERAAELMAMQQDDFNAEINQAFGLRLGKLATLTKRQSFPLMMRHVNHYVEPRLALIGDAAHTLHPLAGQGVNLGILDAACLAHCVHTAHQRYRDVGSLRTLRRYERWRKGDNALMITAMRGFKSLFASSSTLVIPARNLGLNLTSRSTQLKNFFMRIGMGETSELPALAQR